ncbi:MAG TPA: RsmE family RNA methyltransferase [Parachlamydiaceae bacterium]|nr:RsmE family RNA methyltransferase [Parachlamydiaceae bacterium]
MPQERFFVEQPLKEKEIVALDGKEFHHLTNVMRMREKDAVEIINGFGELATATIQSIQKKQALLFIEKVISEKFPSFAVILAQGLPRLNRLDFILEKAVELGATEIWLFPGDLSERKDVSESQKERISAILIAAMKQCGRLHFPKLIFKPKLSLWEDLPYPAFFGDTEKNAPLFSPEEIRKDKGILIFIGPESGFSKKEEEKLKSLKAKGVKLNPYILRTDTAAITALALIAHAIS